MRTAASKNGFWVYFTSWAGHCEVDRKARSSWCQATASLSCRRSHLACGWWNGPGRRGLTWDEGMQQLKGVNAGRKTGDVTIYLRYDHVTVQTSVEALRISLHTHLKKNKSFVSGVCGSSLSHHEVKNKVSWRRRVSDKHCIQNT